MHPEEEASAPSAAAMLLPDGLRKFGGCLTPYERQEITQYPTVYYGGEGCRDKIMAPTTGANDGYDTAEGEYLFRANDHIAYRYEILGELGSGAFGQVLKALDHADAKVVAIKLIRNQRKVLQQAVQEIQILEHVNNRDPKNLYGIVRMKESFSFRGHTCISYELLGENLYDYLKVHNFYPMSLTLIRGIAARMLVSLTFLARENILHCDLKPENILLQGSDPSVVKLVDFGSASFDAKNSYMYIQSRFYRAPEVILEQKFNKAIDWWSFGCILCELANGDPIFPGDDEKDQLGSIMEYLGAPPPHFVSASSSRRRREFFDEQLQPKPYQTRKGKVRTPGSKSLAKFLGVSEDDDFLSFVLQFLQWDPAQRVTPREAMRHKWIVDEFVFPTKAVEQPPATSAPPPPAPAAPEKSSAPAASPEIEQEAATRSAPLVTSQTAHAKSTHDVDAHPRDGAPFKTLAAADAAWMGRGDDPETAVHTMRPGYVPDDQSRSLESTSYLPLSLTEDGGARATAKSAGEPRRSTMARRHRGQDCRGRQHRSTVMAEVDLPGKSLTSTSAVVAESAAEDKNGDVSAEVVAVSVVAGTSSPRSAKGSLRNKQRRSEVVRSPPAVEPDAVTTAIPCSAALPLVGSPHHSVGNPATLPSTNTAAQGALSPRSHDAQDEVSPTGADRRRRVQDLCRKYEAAATNARDGDLIDSLEATTRNGLSGLPQWSHGLDYTTGDRDPHQDGLVASSRNQAVYAALPTAFNKATKGHATKSRREYSLNLDGTPSPPSLGHALSPNTRDEALRMGVALSGSQPRDNGAAFPFGLKRDSHDADARQLRAVPTTPTITTNGPSSPRKLPGPAEVRRRVPDYTLRPRPAQGTAPVTREVAWAGGIGRHDGAVVPPPAAAAMDGAKGRPLQPGGGPRMIPPRQELVQRQRQNMITAISEDKAAPPSATVLPPLKKSFVR